MDCSLGLGYLPVIWALFSVMSFLLTYAVSVAEGHVYFILPTISDTGARIPEANVFSLLINISVIMGLANYFTRYFQCQYQARHCGDRREQIFRYNHAALVLALLSVLGALVVANVQSRKEYYLEEIHDVGAFILFLFTSIYFWLQTKLSYTTSSYGLTAVWLCHVRFLLAVLITCSASVYFVASTISYRMLKSAHIDYAQWRPGNSGYNLHVMSSTSEWLSAIVTMTYVLTYFGEFQHVMLLIDCREKSPTYDGEYSLHEGVDSEEENNN